MPTPEQRQLRVLLQYRTRLMQLKTRLKNIVHAVLARNGYQSPASDLFGRKGRSSLRP
ncbi:MAG: hypothetical protein HPY58_03200 [Firmicutes bacterium]|nr:hypothetical protein [Bacillota bacterium]